MLILTFVLLFLFEVGGNTLLTDVPVLLIMFHVCYQQTGSLGKVSLCQAGTHFHLKHHVPS